MIKLMVALTLTIAPWVQCMQFNIETDQGQIRFPYPHKPYVYEVDGVEYVDPSLRNSTLKLVLQEAFFTNIQQNLVN